MKMFFKKERNCSHRFSYLAFDTNSSFAFEPAYRLVQIVGDLFTIEQRVYTVPDNKYPHERDRNDRFFFAETPTLYQFLFSTL